MSKWARTVKQTTTREDLANYWTEKANDPDANVLDDFEGTVTEYGPAEPVEE